MDPQLSSVLCKKQSQGRGHIRWGRGRGEDKGGKIKGTGWWVGS